MRAKCKVPASGAATYSILLQPGTYDIASEGFCRDESGCEVRICPWRTHVPKHRSIGHDRRMIQGAIIGVIVALTMMFWHRRNAQRGTGLAGAIEEALRGRGSQTLAEVAQAVNKDSFLGRGEVAQALNALVSVNKVRVHPAPDGTPQLKKVDFIRYEQI